MSQFEVDEKYLLRGIALIRKGTDEDEGEPMYVDEMADLLLEVAEAAIAAKKLPETLTERIELSYRAETGDTFGPTFGDRFQAWVRGLKPNRFVSLISLKFVDFAQPKGPPPGMHEAIPGIYAENESKSLFSSKPTALDRLRDLEIRVRALELEGTW